MDLEITLRKLGVLSGGRPACKCYFISDQSGGRNSVGLMHSDKVNMFYDGGFLPSVFARDVYLHVTHGIILIGPHVTPPIADPTTFEVTRNVPPGSIGPLSGPHFPDSLKSSLICDNMAN